MIKKIIVGNWKLNPATPREAKELFFQIKRKIQFSKKISVVICPPAVFLPLLNLSQTRSLAFGGQDAFWENQGAYTGQISPVMFKYSGAKYVIIGHSEKRALGETDDIINIKLKNSLRAGLAVILCVGEKNRDHHGHYLDFLKRQIVDGVKGVTKKDFTRILIAYEPLWAVGIAARGADTPADFLHNALFIKKVIGGLAGKAVAFKVKVLYGGSVNKKNAGDFLAAGEAAGLLVGRASLDPDDFGEIVKIANNL